MILYDEFKMCFSLYKVVCQFNNPNISAGRNHSKVTPLENVPLPISFHMFLSTPFAYQYDRRRHGQLDY